MNSELREKIEELMEMFEVGSGYWPSISVWSMGTFHMGPIPDTLYELLMDIQSLLEEEEAEDNE